jgi:hypothetical protein
MGTVHAGLQVTSGLLAGTVREIVGEGRLTMECARCVSDIDHCHGTVILHPQGVVECTEPECHDLDQVRHALSVDCDLIQGGCDCVELAAVEPLRRAS